MTHVNVGFGRSQQRELCLLLGRPLPATWPYHCTDRDLLPPWLTPTFLLGEYSQVRLKRWAEAGQPNVNVEDVRVVGDAGLMPIVRRVVAALPPPLQHHVLLHGTIHALGLETGGHCAVRSSPVAGAQEREADLVALWRRPSLRCPLRRWHLGQHLLRRLGYHWLPPAPDPVRQFEGVLVHECCHHWLEPIYPTILEPVTLEAIREGREHHDLKLRLAHEWDRLDLLDQWADAQRAERWVALLTAELGYADHVGGDCRFQQQAARARVAVAAAEAADLAACKTSE